MSLKSLTHLSTLLCLSLALKASAQNLVQVDIGQNDDAGQRVQAGWVGWNIGDGINPGREDDVAKERAFTELGGFTVRFESIDVRKRNNMDPANPLGALMEDCIKQAAGEAGQSAIRMTLSGLAPASYRMTTYHHDPNDPDGTFDLFIDAGGGEFQAVDELQQTTGAGAALAPAKAVFFFQATGADVALDFRLGDYQPQSAKEIFLNGFELEKLTDLPDCGFAVTPAVNQAFTVDEGGTPPAPVVYTVQNLGASTLNYTVEELDAGQAPADVPWLVLDRNGGTIQRLGTSEKVTATIDLSKAPAGNLTAYLRFGNGCDPIGYELRRIDLRVLACRWGVDNAVADRTYSLKDPTVLPAPIVYTVSHLAGRDVPYTTEVTYLDPACTGWLQITDGAGTVSAGAPTAQVTATVDPLVLRNCAPETTYTAQVTFKDDGCMGTVTRIVHAYLAGPDSPLRVDLGYIDPDGTGEQLIQAGWVGWNVGDGVNPGRENDVTRSKDFAEFGAFTATLETVDIRRRALVNAGNPLKGLIEDAVKNAAPATGATAFKLTLAGLNAGTYRMKTYHHDSSDPDGTVDIFVDYGYGFSQVADELMQTSGAGAAVVPAIATFEFYALADKPVVLEFRLGDVQLPTGDKEVFLNGFEMEAIPVPPCASGVTPAAAQSAIGDKGGPAPAPVVFEFLNLGQQPVAAYTVEELDAAQQPADVPWMNLDKTSGTASGFAGRDPVAVSFNTAGLDGGTYTAYVRFTDKCNPAGTFVRQVNLVIQGCRWSVGPCDLSRSYLLDYPAALPSPATFVVQHEAGDPVDFVVQVNYVQPACCGWLVLDKTAGTVGAGAPSTQIAAAIDTAALAGCIPGQVYTAQLVFQSVGACTTNPQPIITRTLSLAYLGQGGTHVWSYDGELDPTSPDSAGPGLTFAIREGVANGGTVDDPKAAPPLYKAWTIVDPVGQKTKYQTRLNGPVESPILGEVGVTMVARVKVENLLEPRSMGLEFWDTTGLSAEYHWGGPDGIIRENRRGAQTTVPGSNEYVVIRMTARGGAGDPSTCEREVNLYFNEQPTPVVTRVGAAPSNNTLPEGLGFGAGSTEGEMYITFDWVTATDAGAFAPGEEIAVLGKSLVLNLCADPFADSDRDGDVDQEDFGVWQTCFSGANSALAQPSVCGCFNRDADQDVDIDDLQPFVNCANGPAVPADKNCDG